mmetsp:Transcript_9137/g.37662  ORF Transcript_9137/g.37662 Transcript_9137/m.37662 type:complete len:278 (+) Transcript_9137:410-1243(+)
MWSGMLAPCSSSTDFASSTCASSEHWKNWLLCISSKRATCFSSSILLLQACSSSAEFISRVNTWSSMHKLIRFAWSGLLRSLTTETKRMGRRVMKERIPFRFLARSTLSVQRTARTGSSPSPLPPARETMVSSSTLLTSSSSSNISEYPDLSRSSESCCVRLSWSACRALSLTRLAMEEMQRQALTSASFSPPLLCTSLSSSPSSVWSSPAASPTPAFWSSLMRRGYFSSRCSGFTKNPCGERPLQLGRGWSRNSPNSAFASRKSSIRSAERPWFPQ